MEVVVEGSRVRVKRSNNEWEAHEFPTTAEAEARAAIVREALTWIGTPFKNCSDIKGKRGGVDCAMLLVRCYVDTGRLPPFDPRPYPPHWFLHQDGERFLEWIRDKLGGVEIEKPRLGDCIVYFFGKCFSHGAISVSSEEIVHAYALDDFCEFSSRDETRLTTIAHKFHRPVKFFEVAQK